MTEKRPIDANELMARFFRKECLMRGHNAAASAAYKDAQKTVTAAPTVSLRPEWRNPETDPPKVEEDVMILFETACGGYGITTAHYEDGTVLSEKSVRTEILGTLYKRRSGRLEIRRDSSLSGFSL